MSGHHSVSEADICLGGEAACLDVEAGMHENVSAQVFQQLPMRGLGRGVWLAHEADFLSA